MFVPHVTRYFDAINIETGYRCFYLNRTRLLTAMAIIELLGSLEGAVEWLEEEHPTIGPAMAVAYIQAAHVCVRCRLTI